MITVRDRPCQTLRVLTLAGWCLLMGGRLIAGSESPPRPPVWQQEINAARLLESSLALNPPTGAAEAETRRQHFQTLYIDLAKKYPGAADVQKAAADFLSRDGQGSAALPYWERAELLDPHDGDTANRLGGEFLRLGRTRDAYQRFQRAVDAQPGSASYHFDLANVLYLFRRDLVSPPVAGVPDEQEALALALTHFRRAAELAPGDLRLARAYAETFYVFAKPDWPAALTAWESVLALSGEDGDFANSHLARISLRQGKPDAASRYLARIHAPAFDGLKAQLQKQADRQTEPTAPAASKIR